MKKTKYDTEEEGRELKITILVSEEERIRIRRAALGDKKGRSVSTIGRELLLDYAEKMERKEGIENPQSRTLTEREQRETLDFTEEDIREFEKMEKELAETPIETDIEEAIAETEEIEKELKKEIESTKKTSKSSSKKKDSTPKASSRETESRPNWIKFSKNGIDSPFTEEEIEKAKEFIIGLLEKNPRGELSLMTIIEEGHPLGYKGGQLGDSITMNRDTFDYYRDNWGEETVKLRKRKN